MKTTEEQKAFFYEYLEKTDANYTVDHNPSEEKISRIRQAIMRKEQLLQRAIDKFSSSTGINVNA